MSKLEVFITVCIITIIGTLAITGVRVVQNARKAETSIPLKEFTEPSASVTQMGRSGGWALVKLSVHGHDELVWIYLSQSSIVRVPPIVVEKP